MKQIENRTWRTYHRGPLASQADKTLMRMKEVDPKLWPKRYRVKRPQAGDLAFGAFVAVAELVDCVPIDRLQADLKDHLFASAP